MATNLLSEAESAQLAGVSTDTIRRYRELGLLPAEILSDGPFYREVDLRTLFYTRIQAKSENDTLKNDKDSKRENGYTPYTQATVYPDLPPGETLETLLTASPELRKAAAAADAESRAASAADQQAVSESASTAAPVSEAPPPVSESFERNLPAVSQQELVEVNKGLRAQLELLREERSWLRERVEKLETQAERSQMLLLSESENIRMLSGQNRRRNFWQFALPWISADKK